MKLSNLLIMSALLGVTMGGSAMAADSCLFGRVDDFVNAEVELPEPGPLVNVLVGYSNQPLLAFDECAVNRYFGHNTTACLPPDSLRLVMRVRLKAFGSQSNTDVFYLGAAGGTFWGMRMNGLGSIFGAGPTWNSGDTATVVLDLENLPASDQAPSYGPDYSSGVTTMIPWIRLLGSLSIVVADDTCVDFIALTLEPRILTPTLSSSWGRLKLLYR